MLLYILKMRIELPYVSVVSCIILLLAHYLVYELLLDAAFKRIDTVLFHAFCALA